MLSDDEKLKIEEQERYRAELRLKYGSTNSKSKGLAIFLAIVLGGLGAHKFYLGKAGWGVMYLLFSWTGIPMVVGIIEGLSYLFRSDSSFKQKYG